MKCNFLVAGQFSLLLGEDFLPILPILCVGEKLDSK